MQAESYLKSQVESRLAEAKGIVSAAEGDGRHLSEDEHKRVAALTSDVERLRAELSEMQSARELRESIDNLGKTFSGGQAKAIDDRASRTARTLGEAFVKSADYKALKASGRLETEGQFTMTVELPYGRKANETVGSAGVPAEDYIPGVQLLLDATADSQPNTLMGVLPVISTNSNRVRYIAETTSTNAADAIAELGSYSQSVLIHADTTVPVEKIGTSLFVSDEFFADASALSGYLDGRLGAFVSYEEEDQVINGNGTPPALTGFLQAVTQSQPLGADTIADALYKAKTDVRTGGWVEPTHLLVNPTDWEKIRLAKDASDKYLMEMGPYAAAGASEPSVWGLTPLITTRIAAGTAMVGAFSNPVACQLVRRGGVTVEASNSHASFFTTGQVAIRATSRLALVVYRAGAFSEVTGL